MFFNDVQSESVQRLSDTHSWYMDTPGIHNDFATPRTHPPSDWLCVTDKIQPLTLSLCQFKALVPLESYYRYWPSRGGILVIGRPRNGYRKCCFRSTHWHARRGMALEGVKGGRNRFEDLIQVCRCPLGLLRTPSAYLKPRQRNAAATRVRGRLRLGKVDVIIQHRLFDSRGGRSPFCRTVRDCGHHHRLRRNADSEPTSRFCVGAATNAMVPHWPLAVTPCATQTGTPAPRPTRYPTHQHQRRIERRCAMHRRSDRAWTSPSSSAARCQCWQSRAVWHGHRDTHNRVKNGT